MSRFTKISRRRTGSPRFEHDPESTKPGPVKTYFLSEEELEHYRAMDKPKGKAAKRPTFLGRWNKKEANKLSINITEANLTKEKYLELKKEGHSDSKIYQSLGKHSNWMNEKKREWGLIGVKLDRDGNLIGPEEAITDNTEVKEDIAHEFEGKGEKEVQELSPEQLELLEQIDSLRKKLSIERQLSAHLEQEVQELKREKWRLQDQVRHLKKAHKHFVEAMSI